MRTDGVHRLESAGTGPVFEGNHALISLGKGAGHSNISTNTMDQ